MTTILTTTGISLKLNAARALGSSPSDLDLRQYLHTDPSRASAELNALLRFASTNDHLVLLHTDNAEAERCANLLCEYLIEQGFTHTRLVKLELQDQEEHLETRGLRNLVDALIREIEAAQRAGSEVVINATAGLKAQVVYSTMLGMIYHIPVKYIYETFQRLVTFNPIPLDWNTDIVLANRVFFAWIDDEPRQYDAIHSRLSALPERAVIETMLTPPDSDGHIFLSPMGAALYRCFVREVEATYLATWPPASKRNSRQKIAESIRKHKHHFPRHLLDMCERMATVDAVHEIIGGNFESTTLSRIKRIDDDGNIRLLLADKDKAANITVMTTARGRSQTLKVAERLRELLEI